jgi:hypothetical protein
MKIKKVLLACSLLFYLTAANGHNYKQIIKESFQYCQEKNGANYQRIVEFGSIQITPEELLLKCAKGYTEKVIFDISYKGYSEEYIYSTVKQKIERLTLLLQQTVNRYNHSEIEQAELEEQLKCYRFQNFMLTFHYHLKVKNNDFLTEQNFNRTLIKTHTFLINGCGKSYF